MSEQEKTSGGTAQVGSVIMMEKTKSSRHHKPCQPNEPQDGTDLHHKRAKAPVVPSGAEELKNVAENSTLNECTAIEDRKECAHAISSDKHKHSVAKKISSTKKRELSPESIKLENLQIDKKKPIPSEVPSDLIPKEKAAIKNESKTYDSDSITDEITELRPEVAKDHSEWSDVEEAGGLPRTDSRGSRVSRAVRQLFCCGVGYEAPSEDDISTHRFYPI